MCTYCNDRKETPGYDIKTGQIVWNPCRCNQPQPAPKPNVIIVDWEVVDRVAKTLGKGK